MIFDDCVKTLYLPIFNFSFAFRRTDTEERVTYINVLFTINCSYSRKFITNALMNKPNNVYTDLSHREFYNYCYLLIFVYKHIIQKLFSVMQF